MKRTDIFLIIALVVAGFAALYFVNPGTEAAAAEVYQEGVLVWQCPLNTAGEFQSGGVLVEVAGGRARILASDCPDQICVNRGWISRAGQSLVCLPNRLSVVLTGTDALDAVLD